MRRLTDHEKIKYILDQLEGGQYDYIQKNCLLPPECTPCTSDIVFTTDGRFYTIYLNGNVSCSPENQLMYAFCQDGFVTFPSEQHMLNFFTHISQSIDQGSFAANSFNPDAVDKTEVMSMYNRDQDKPIDTEAFAEELKRSVFGQDEVIKQVSEKIAVHMLRKKKRLLSMIFFGKTGTGKSSLAKALPKTLTRFCGKEYGFIEIAGNELMDKASMTRFFGAPPEYVGYGKPTFFEPIKENPYMVVVINEIEKATEDLFTRLMECLDTSTVKLADNTTIDLSHCIFLFTTNLPIDTGKFSKLLHLKQLEFLRGVFSKFCGRPEIAARIGNYCVFKDLDMDADITILTRDIAELLDDFGLRLERIETPLMVELLKNKSAYGARAHMHTIEETVGAYLLRHQELRNTRQAVVLKGTIDNLEIEAA